MNEVRTVRAATMADLEVIAGLFAEFRDSLQKAHPTLDELRTSLACVLREPNYRIFLALRGTEAVGYVAVRMFVSAWVVGKEAVLEDLFVRAKERNGGVGKQLVQAALAEAKAAGCRAISLDTNERNEASNALYRRLGFTCERARWNGGRQIRYDLKLTD